MFSHLSEDCAAASCVREQGLFGWTHGPFGRDAVQELQYLPRSLAVHSPSERTDGPSGRAVVPVLNPEYPVRRPSGRLRTRHTKRLEKAMLP
jgi:hypothetical protein